MFMSPSGRPEQDCSDLCDHNATDKVITTAEGKQLDYQRFCYFECGPSAALGSTCVPRSISGNSTSKSVGRKLAALPVIHHHRHHRHHKPHHTAQIARGTHFQRLVSAKNAAGAEPWPSMKGEKEDVYSAIGLRSEQEWRQAAKDSKAASEAAKENAKIA